MRRFAGCIWITVQTPLLLLTPALLRLDLNMELVPHLLHLDFSVDIVEVKFETGTDL